MPDLCLLPCLFQVRKQLQPIFIPILPKCLTVIHSHSRAPKLVYHLKKRLKLSIQWSWYVFTSERMTPTPAADGCDKEWSVRNLLDQHQRLSHDVMWCGKVAHAADSAGLDTRNQRPSILCLHTQPYFVELPSLILNGPMDNRYTRTHKPPPWPSHCWDPHPWENPSLLTTPLSNLTSCYGACLTIKLQSQLWDWRRDEESGNWILQSDTTWRSVNESNSNWHAVCKFLKITNWYYTLSLAC